MSSRRRRSKGTVDDPFANLSPVDNEEIDEAVSPPNSLESFASMMYSKRSATDEIAEKLRTAEARAIRIRYVAIDHIRPDPAQARRVMPIDLRARWLRKPTAVDEVLQTWLERADAEAARGNRPPINIEEILSRDPDNHLVLAEEGDEEDERVGPVEGSFRAMLQLAASIRHHGLTNPVTVVDLRDGNYLLETGERRLLAYNLLHSLASTIQGDFSQIPARIVDRKSTWRQAAENGARQDLNAISMARQLALLLMDIYADRVEFADYKDMPGVEWYAQVYDSKKFPVPYGRGNELAAAMGLKSANQLRQYRSLLSLPNQVWELADEHNWTEYKIRTLMKTARDVSAKANRTGESVTDVTHLAGDTLETSDFSLTGEPTNGKSVTDVTDFTYYLDQLAQLEAKMIEQLPFEIVTPASSSFAPPASEITTPLAPYPTPEALSGDAGGAPRPRRITLLSHVAARIVELDLERGTLTLNFSDPIELEPLSSVSNVLLTIQQGTEE